MHVSSFRARIRFHSPSITNPAVLLGIFPLAQSGLSRYGNTSEIFQSEA